MIIVVSEADRVAAAKALGYKTVGDATDYRNTGAEDRAFEQMVQHFARRAATARLEGALAMREGALDLEPLAEALYRLSDRLRTSTFMHDQDNHGAYEAVVSAFQALSPTDPISGDGGE